MSASHPQPIGNLNGPWSILLRIFLGTYPVVLAWAVWVTNNQFQDIAFRNNGDRFTREDAVQMELRIMGKFSELPPQDWRDRIKSLESVVQENNVRIIRIETMLDSLRQGIQKPNGVPYP